MTDDSKNIIDLASIATVVGTLAGLLPAMAALFTIIWTAIRIYESDTCRSIIRRIRGK